MSKWTTLVEFECPLLMRWTAPTTGIDDVTAMCRLFQWLLAAGLAVNVAFLKARLAD